MTAERQFKTGLLRTRQQTTLPPASWLYETMKAPGAVILLLVLGSLIFATGLSARVWRREESHYRVLSVLVGLLLMIMATLVLLRVIDFVSD